MARRSVLILIVAVLVLGAALVPASAGLNNGASFTLGCDGFTSTGGEIQLDRDNTGNLREAFIVSATDGAGTVIYEPVEDTFFVGGTVSWAGSDLVPWTRTPLYNPLTLRVVSRAGNFFDEQVIVLATGACEGLPGYSALPGNVFIVDGDTLVIDGRLQITLGATSRPVGLNENPPRPTNPPELSETLIGYLLVNTDNLSVRSGDSPNYSLVGVVDGGTVLVPLGRNADFSWWYIQAGDVVGWTKAEFLIARGDLTEVPVIEAQGEIAIPRLFVFIDSPLYAAPRTSSLPLCIIPGDLEYQIVGRDRQVNWFEIQTTCDNVLVRGWIPADRGGARNPGEVDIPITTP